MAKNKAVSKQNANGLGPGKSGARALPAFINLHSVLDKPIVQSGPKLGSNKLNKISKVSK